MTVGFHIPPLYKFPLNIAQSSYPSDLDATQSPFVPRLFHHTPWLLILPTNITMDRRSYHDINNYTAFGPPINLLIKYM